MGVGAVQKVLGHFDGRNPAWRQGGLELVYAQVVQGVVEGASFDHLGHPEVLDDQAGKIRQPGRFAGWPRADWARSRHVFAQAQGHVHDRRDRMGGARCRQSTARICSTMSKNG